MWSGITSAQVTFGEKDPPEHIFLQAGIPTAAQLFTGLHVWLPSEVRADPRGPPQKGTLCFPGPPIPLLLVTESRFSVRNTPSAALGPCGPRALRAQAPGLPVDVYTSNVTHAHPLMDVQVGR